MDKVSYWTMAEGQSSAGGVIEPDRRLIADHRRGPKSSGLRASFSVTLGTDQVDGLEAPGLVRAVFHRLPTCLWQPAASRGIWPSQGKAASRKLP